MHAARCPALVVAAPASGQGKTTVTAALARLHARAGRRVRVFKCGPDHLDPHWHELASGATVHPLDLWLTGEEDCRRRLHEAAGAADLVLIEGVMGLFDGEHSVGELARRLGIPVLVVIDAGAMGGTFGALAHGLRSYWPDLPWAGVLANRVAGERHAQMLRAGLRDAGDWWGALPRVAAAGEGRGEPGGLLPERQLGLVAARELPDALARLDAAADALAGTPLGRLGLAGWQRWAVDFPAPAAPAPVPQLLGGWRVAVARDEAFSLVHAANLDTLRALGAQLQCFAPLRGEALPTCDALWLPGGQPERHAPALAAQAALRAQLQEHVALGRPIWAEGGALGALAQSVTLADGTRFPMWGLLPGHAVVHRRLRGLGPRELRLQQPASEGPALRGHSFHYTSLDCSAPPIGHALRPGSSDALDGGEAVYRHGSIRASFFQPWFPSAPAVVAQLFGAAGHQGGG
ncbi:cobyrinic acid a,c-diamide synthase [Melaminivora alkalimesophila]|uniref:Cobyrinic acid a,c-diamide synthase n=1 Tax=Melaminivora alkalimesophila TaxID=1165852 RepID=A0A317RCP6_9BURK|nr:cobyrinate a,c-diamide synthase [Melaminivora alkalimesophila]PWW46253.1 cobyrinic acid a,c-diamide synthase [Melaminivora alkalimesophila]